MLWPARLTIVIALVFTGIVGVLWIGARDVREELMSIGALIQRSESVV